MQKKQKIEAINKPYQQAVQIRIKYKSPTL